MLACSIVYLLVISTAQTKLGWYDMPVYPLLAIVIAVSVFTIFNFIYSSNISRLKKILLFFFTTSLFVIPISIHLNKVYKIIKTQNQNNEMCAAYFLHRNMKYEMINLNNCYVQGNLDCSYAGPIEFYKELYKNKNQQLHLFFLEYRYNNCTL